jgi:hypothetical protein
MGKNGRYKRPDSINSLEVYKTIRNTERPRSTVFSDEVDKAERRNNRRHNERKLIEDELDLEMEILDDLDY